MWVLLFEHTSLKTLLIAPLYSEVVGKFIDQSGCTVVMPSVAPMLHGSAEEICQYMGMLSKSVPCIHAVPTCTEFSKGRGKLQEGNGKEQGMHGCM